MIATLLFVLAIQAASPGVVGEVRVHGNHTTPDADVLGIVGDVVGKPATDALIKEISNRLDKSGRFDSVEVLKRYRSIENPDDILLMVIVDERPGISEIDLTPGPWKRITASGMFMPILHYDDGYGFTYGARMSFVDPVGPRSRLSFPLTWGGERAARAQLESQFRRGRLGGDAGISRRKNPYYGLPDTRSGLNARAEGSIKKWLRVGAGIGAEHVDFDDLRDTLRTTAGDVTLDTRVDPAFPRNAVNLKYGVERLNFDGGKATRKTADLQGFLGLIGQPVLSVRGLFVTSKDPLPRYEHALLGGSSTLRGFDAGFQANDNLGLFSAELRIPFTSPLDIGRTGVKLFSDWGATYAAGEKLKDQTLHNGYGAGLYFQMTILSMGFDIARSDTGHTRFMFDLGVTFK
jgi:outer membrane protein assembly factor BamA